MSVYKRPLRSDELYHWGKGSVSGNHKYLAKIGNRYFYTPEELKAFKQGVSGAGKKIGDNFNKLRQHVYDAAGGAAKRKAQVTAAAANRAKTNLANARQNSNDATWNAYYAKNHFFAEGSSRNHPGMQQALDNEASTAAKNKYIRWVSANGVRKEYEGDRDTGAKIRRTQRNNDRERRMVEDDRKKAVIYEQAENKALRTQRKANEAKAAYDRTPVGIAENAGKKVNHAKNSIERGKKKVQDYLADRKRQAEESKRIGEEMKEAEKRGEVTTLSDGTKVRIGEVKVGAIETPKKKRKK